MLADRPLHTQSHDPRDVYGCDSAQTPIVPFHVLTKAGMHYNTEAGEHDLHSYILNPEILKVKDGYLDALTGPGLGIEVDEEAVRRVAANTAPWELQGFVGVDGGLREW
jgi:hypothetical protein